MPEQSGQNSPIPTDKLVQYPAPESSRLFRTPDTVDDSPVLMPATEVSIDELKERRMQMRSRIFDMFHGEKGLFEYDDLTDIMHADWEVVLECAEESDEMYERLSRREWSVAEYIIYRFHEAVGNDGLEELDGLRQVQADLYQIDSWAVNFINIARMYILAVDNRGDLTDFARAWDLPETFDPLGFRTFGVLKEGAVNELTEHLLADGDRRLQKEGIVVSDDDSLSADDDDEFDEDDIDMGLDVGINLYASLPTKIVHTYHKRFPGTIIVLPGSVEIYDEMEDGKAICITNGSLRPPIRVPDFSDNTVMISRNNDPLAFKSIP